MRLSIKSCSWFLFLGLIVGGFFMGCEKKEEKSAAPTVAAVSLPAGLFLSQAPSGTPTDIAQAVSSIKNGEKVLITGVVGGRKEPFVPNRAAVLITDKSVPSCIAEGDDCKTPWDYCCTPKEKLKGHLALVQIADAGGEPLKTTLDKAGGLAPLKTVLVEGIAQRDDKDAGTLTINATGIYVQP